MNYEKFASTLSRLGLTELSNESVRKLFDSYGSNGTVKFSAFIKDVVEVSDIFAFAFISSAHPR
jgi:hypothetical protein